MKNAEGKSFGVYDAYKAIRKKGWLDIGRPLKEHEFYTIVRGMNDFLAKKIAEGSDVVFPYRMGKLELRKSKRGVSLCNGKLKITYPVDWKNTLKLWNNDEEAKKSKTLIRFENDYIYHVRYCKNTAAFENKTFFEFHLNRKIKRALKDNINNGKIDTVW